MLTLINTRKHYNYFFAFFFFFLDFMLILFSIFEYLIPHFLFVGVGRGKIAPPTLCAFKNTCVNYLIMAWRVWWEFWEIKMPSQNVQKIKHKCSRELWKNYKEIVKDFYGFFFKFKEFETRAMTKSGLDKCFGF